MPSKSIRIPITNIYDGNDFSATIMIGSKKKPANVILDTGSSTLAVKPSTYDGAKDSNMQPTSLAQLVQYGTGGWGGPVVHTSLAMGLTSKSITINKAPIAITFVQERGNFIGVDGIMGLAYNALNDAHDFKSYFQMQGKPAVTHPWPFPAHSYKKFVTQFSNFIKKDRIPRENLAPYFTGIENEGILANKFAFYTLRSSVHYKNKSSKNAGNDPLNNGFFIMGGGEEQKDLYQGSFKTLKVVHDLYYNTNLKSVQVQGCPSFNALPLQDEYKNYLVSNSIIDSGTSFLALSNDVLNGILASFKKLDPNFIKIIKTAIGGGSIATSLLKLGNWPAINFTFSGENNEDVTLSCSPQTYWQVNFPKFGQAMLQMGPFGDKPNQSIFGLPLMNNYYTIFDRSQDKWGVVRLAAIKL